MLNLKMEFKIQNPFLMAYQQANIDFQAINHTLDSYSAIFQLFLLFEDKSLQTHNVT